MVKTKKVIGIENWSELGQKVIAQKKEQNWGQKSELTECLSELGPKNWSGPHGWSVRLIRDKSPIKHTRIKNVIKIEEEVKMTRLTGE